jgi:hypothetical protein
MVDEVLQYMLKLFVALWFNMLLIGLYVAPKKLASIGNKSAKAVTTR